MSPGLYLGCYSRCIFKHHLTRHSSKTTDTDHAETTRLPTGSILPDKGDKDGKRNGIFLTSVLQLA